MRTTRLFLSKQKGDKTTLALYMYVCHYTRPVILINSQPVL